jgi:heme A synthase
MIFGRPANLIVGAFQAVLGAVVLALGALEPPIVIPATVVAAVVIAFGAVIALVANQPPTLNPGDQFRTATPPGTPNYVTTVATPPAADAPPVPDTIVPVPPKP